MDEKEREVIRKLLDEMKTAHGLVQFWLKGTPIERTLGDWIKQLEPLLKS